MPSVRAPRDVLAELVEPRGRTVVDVGCGDGGLVRWLAARGAHAIGVDVESEALARARAVRPVSDERYEPGTAQGLPLPDGCADAVVFVHSLHHVPGDALDRALLEAARVLVSGGALYVQEPLAEGPHFDLMRPVDDETAVRSAAQAALARVPADVLRHEREERFDAEVHYGSFDAFRDRIVLADAARAVFFAAHEDDLRARFAAAVEPGANGSIRLRQPMKVDLLRHPASAAAG